MSEQRPITYEEMLEFYRLLIQERQEQRIDDERRRAEEEKRRVEREELEAKRRAEEDKRRTEQESLETKRRAEQEALEAKRRAEQEALAEKRRAEEEERRAKWIAEEEERRAKWVADREKAQQAIERSAKEANRKISALGSRLGTMIEHMVAGKGNIVKKFQALGYNISGYGPNWSFGDPESPNHGEIDIFLEDGNIAILVEVKTTLETADVRRHIERMEKFRCYSDAKGDTRHFVGAVAGAVVEDSVLQFARENGMYTIVQSGKVFDIVVPEGFKPKEW